MTSAAASCRGRVGKSMRRSTMQEAQQRRSSLSESERMSLGCGLRCPGSFREADGQGRCWRRVGLLGPALPLAPKSGHSLLGSGLVPSEWTGCSLLPALAGRLPVTLPLASPNPGCFSTVTVSAQSAGFSMDSPAFLSYLRKKNREPLESATLSQWTALGPMEEPQGRSANPLSRQTRGLKMRKMR